MLRTFAVHVLGCKVNQVEACQVETLLEMAGLEPAPPGTTPDLCIVHTCGVTRTALAKSARRARSIARGPSHLLLTGCGVLAEEAAAFPADALRVASGPGWFSALCEALDRLPLPRPVPADARTADGPGLSRFHRHARAFLKIQDGCDLGCSYCIVPRLRKAPRDRPLDRIVDEARRLVVGGHTELVVTGVSVGLFGRDGPVSLATALAAIARVPGIARLRLSSLHPAELTDELLRFWADCPRMAPHIHLPLQSGSDTVLERMRRGYTAGGFLAAADRACRYLGNPSFSTDVIVGFPGESDRDDEDTRALCRRMGFIRMHVFPFSSRPGTAAARMTPRVPDATIRERAARMRALAEDLAREAHRAAVGRPAEVLCEVRNRAGLWSGYSAHYLPVRFPGPPGWAGRIVHAAPARFDEDGLFAPHPPAEDA